MTAQVPLDSCVKSIIASFQQRAAVGWKKYGTNLDRQDLSVLEWIQHAQEEHMDAILYLEKLKQEFSKQNQPQQQQQQQEQQQPPFEPKLPNDLHWGC